jgi:hypothetical protein
MCWKCRKERTKLKLERTTPYAKLSEEERKNIDKIRPYYDIGGAIDKYFSDAMNSAT